MRDGDQPCTVVLRVPQFYIPYSHPTPVFLKVSFIFLVTSTFHFLLFSREYPSKGRTSPSPKSTSGAHAGLGGLASVDLSCHCSLFSFLSMKKYVSV